MQALLEQFSPSDILIFIVLLTLALKGCISMLEWFEERGLRFFHKQYQKPKELQETVKKLVSMVNNMSDQIAILIDSDKDDIKAFITREHHYFCYQKGEIDDQSLDCIEKRYTHYKDEGGNSYIYDLMVDLRNLPKVQPQRHT